MFKSFLLLAEWKNFSFLKKTKQLIVSSFDQVNVVDSYFAKIFSNEEGGAIKYDNENPNSEIIISRVYISECKSTINFGAIYSYSNKATFSKICGYSCSTEGIGQFYYEAAEKCVCTDSSFSHTTKPDGYRSLINYGNTIQINGLNVSYINIFEISCLQLNPIQYAEILYSSFTDSEASSIGFVHLNDEFGSKESLYLTQNVHFTNFINNVQTNYQTAKEVFGVLYVNGYSYISNSNFYSNKADAIFAQEKCTFSEEVGFSYSTFDNCFIDKNQECGAITVGKTPAGNIIDHEVLFKVEFLYTGKCEIKADHTINNLYGEARKITCDVMRNYRANHLINRYLFV